MNRRHIIIVSMMATMLSSMPGLHAQNSGGSEAERKSKTPPRAISKNERAELEARVRQLVAPRPLEELSKPAKSSGTSVGSVSIPSQSFKRDDGVSVTIMSAQKGSAPPANVGVWHGKGAKQSGFAAMFGGNVGKLVLRMHDPDPSPAAEPFGFRRVRLFDDGHEKEYRLEGDLWMLAEYDGAER